MFTGHLEGHLVAEPGYGRFSEWICSWDELLYDGILQTALAANGRSATLELLLWQGCQCFRGWRGVWYKGHDINWRCDPLTSNIHTWLWFHSNLTRCRILKVHPSAKAQLFCIALCTGSIAMKRHVAITGTRVPIRSRSIASQCMPCWLLKVRVGTHTILSSFL